MKKILLLFIILSTFSLSAIDEFQTDIYDGNGILTTEKESSLALNETLKSAILHDIYNGEKKRMQRL